MKKFLCLFIFVFLFSACGPTDSQIKEAIQKTNDAVDELTANYVSPTPEITNTPTITKTTHPTITPKPTSTPTPKPDAIIIEGSGDDVIEINKWEGMAIVDVEAYARGYFGVKTFDKNGDQLELLVNAISPYEGKVIMDLLTYGETNATMIQVEASGDWKISIYPLDIAYLNVVDAPGYYEGFSADVVYLDGESSTATFKSSDGYFGVKAISDSVDLLVNDIAPYEGTVIVPSGTLLLIVDAEADWSVEFH